MALDLKPREQWLKSREISERIVVEGTLVLETPTSLSNGDADGETDIALLTDPLEGRALLTGASIAGALRNYMRERRLDYSREEFFYKDGQRNRAQGGLDTVTRLFGSLEDDGEQSHLIVDDAFYPPLRQPAAPPHTELRDGVRIDGRTGTAFEGHKFDLELLEAGTTFPLRFELLISDYRPAQPKDKNDTNAPERESLIEALALALQGFEAGEIYLGGRKRRGYGQCRVQDWVVTRYNLRTKKGLLAWLSPDLGQPQWSKPDKIATAFTEVCDLPAGLALTDNRTFFTMTAQFALEDSLLIRSGARLQDDEGDFIASQPDAVHLHSQHIRNGQSVYAPIVSGTSLAGALRHRAFRIANTVATGKTNKDTGRNIALQFIDGLFGADLEEQKKSAKRQGKLMPQPVASRLEVRETIIEDVKPLVQNRVQIDRFTGGAYESALFNEAPVFAQSSARGIEINLTLRATTKSNNNGPIMTDQERTDSETGLLLLLLKDMWTADLAIGGEASVGRGRLRGLSATLEYHTPSPESSWKVLLTEESHPDTPNQKQIKLDNVVEAGRSRKHMSHASLNTLVDAFHRELMKNHESGGTA